MTFLMLGWTDGGFVTLNLRSGERLVLVHTDERLARACASVARSKQPGRTPAIGYFDWTREELVREMREEFVREGGEGDSLDFIFPDDPRYDVIIDELTSS